jgi:hypothetical protein
LFFNLFYNLDNTITIILLAFFSCFFILFKNYLLKIINNRLFLITILLSPFFITGYVVSLKSIGNYDFTTLLGFAEFKLMGDRKPIWDETWRLIINSNFFYSLPGAELYIYFDFRNQYVPWPMGSHNIFLELTRNISLFGSICIYFLITYRFFFLSKNITNTKDSIIFFSFLNVYIIYGITGNSLVSDGVGFLFWTLFSSFYYLKITKYKITN